MPVTDFLIAGVGLPSQDRSLAAAWIAVLHQMARETGSRVKGQLEPPDSARNHYRQQVSLATGEDVYVLLNAAVRLVACQLHGDLAMPFVDVPRPDLFELAGFSIASRDDLEQELRAADAAGLSHLELRDIHYHRPTRIGDVIYNWFD